MKQPMLRSILFLFTVFILSTGVQAKIILPRIFSDNMVLQRNVPIPVWGWAAPHEKITVRFKQQVRSVIADRSGKWKISLGAEKAGGPFDLYIYGSDSVHLKNILVGEVWICSGQSNMEWSVVQSLQGDQEVAAANNPMIRHIKIAKTINSIPEENFSGGDWEVCNSSTAGAFTGVGYFFARQLFDSLKVPVGLINTSWGGTNIETWISREGFESSDEFKTMIANMPKIDLAAMTKMKLAAITKRVEQLQGAILDPVGSRRFNQINFDDSHWPKMHVPELWESQSLGEIDGVVWFRKTIVLPQANADKEALLELAKIDDDDITYVNGVKVGSTNQWDAKRKYRIAPGILKSGENIIAVRVVDNGGGGGIYGDSADLKLTVSDTVILLWGNWKYQVESLKNATGENTMPSLCFNAMINPLIPYAIRGFLWYQGESNAMRAYQYRKAFPLLINDWRTKWKRADLPFYFVQLATFRTTGNSNEGCDWAELREAQASTLRVPYTGICVTTDIGNPNDIHPLNKQVVAQRLAAVALHNTYKKLVACNGPSYSAKAIKGRLVIVSFNHTGGGLTTSGNEKDVNGFELAGTDQIFYPAKGLIKNNRVYLSSDKVAKPLAVRFGWIGDASANNLFNREGFPAVPFRTDDWKTITKNVKYTLEPVKL